MVAELVSRSAASVLWLAVAMIAPQCVFAEPDAAVEQRRIVVSADGSHFVNAGTDERVVLWGFNYDHDGPGRLIEDYWHEEWDEIEADFAEMKAMGANVVRIHLQIGRFLSSAEEANEGSLKQLARLIDLSERTGLYLNLTGLGCYHKDDVPLWYDDLAEADRWAVQARFWQAVAGIGRESNAVFCYDLMNEPILPGKKGETEWLAGELGGKHFVQRISLDLAGRSRDEVARTWVETMTSAIREVDDRHLITLGVIPWAHTWPKAKPIFYSKAVGESLDFVSVHFYPKAGEVDRALEALRVYEIGKPLVVEEFFPLKCSLDEAARFVNESRSTVDGWTSFYWGISVEEYEARSDLSSAIIASWLKRFEELRDVSTK